MLNRKYSGITGWMLWLLIFGFLIFPGYQQHWYHICVVWILLSSIGSFLIPCNVSASGNYDKIMTIHANVSNTTRPWGRVTHICVGKLTIIGSDNGFSPGRHQAIIWTIAGILLIRPLGTKFNEILIRIQTFSFKKMHLKMSSAKWRPFVSASMC